MVWQKCTIEWHHWFVINHSELLEYNHLVPLHGGLQDGVNIIKNRIFQHVRPVRFYSSTMHLWKDWLAKLRFFSLMFSPLPITKQQQKKPCINFTPDRKTDTKPCSLHHLAKLASSLLHFSDLAIHHVTHP